MSHLAVLLHYCHGRRLRPHIRFSSPAYLAAGERDWFDTVFRLRPRGVEPVAFRPRVKIGTGLDYRLADLDSEPTLEQAATAMRRFVTFDETVVREADAFAVAHGLDATSIAVHFRGTDKDIEAPRVDWKTLFAAVRLAARAAPQARIFLTSDEPELIAAARATEFADRLVVFPCQEIFTGGRPALMAATDRRRLAQEAAITLLIMAKCGASIRTASHLSAWASLINPQQRVVMLNQPYGDAMPFPERQIWARRLEPEQLAAWLKAKTSPSRRVRASASA